MSEPKLTEAERERIESTTGARLFAAVESILADRLTPLLGANDDLREVIDEARANRDRLTHKVAALRRQVADLEERVATHCEERDEALAQVADLTAERDAALGGLSEWQDNHEQALERIAAWVERCDRLEERADAAERAIERVRALAERVEDGVDVGSYLRSAWQQSDTEAMQKLRELAESGAFDAGPDASGR